MFFQILNCIFVTIICFLQVSALVSAENKGVPVIVKGIEFQSGSFDPFERTSKSEFEDILIKNFGKNKPPIIVFVRDNFCMEHIRQNKKSFQSLDQKSLKLLPSVGSAFTVFENLPSYSISTGRKVISQVLPNGHLVIVRISNFEEIPNSYNRVKGYNKNLVIAITGRTCSFAPNTRRVKRAATDQKVEKKNDTFVAYAKNLLMYADKNPIIQFNGSEPVNLGSPTSVKDIYINKTLFEYELEFDNDGKLKMTFVNDRGYYKLKNIEYSDDGNDMLLLNSNFDISFPVNYSYHCSENITFRDVNKSATINFLNFQVQISNQENFRAFGRAYDCVGYTSIPILSGLFVTAILALITMWGLTMVLDIRSNDRLDDPKGKTIIVSASG